MKPKTSSYPGVCIQVIFSHGKRYEYFKAQSSLNGKKVNLGLFKCEEKAYKAYLDWINLNYRKIGNNKRYKALKAA